jgi:hypothetical protein
LPAVLLCHMEDLRFRPVMDLNSHVFSKNIFSFEDTFSVQESASDIHTQVIGTIYNMYNNNSSVKCNLIYLNEDPSTKEQERFVTHPFFYFIYILYG